MSFLSGLQFDQHFTRAMCIFLDSGTPETPKTVVLGFLGVPRLPISQILGVLGVLESRLPRLPLPSNWGFWESRESGLRDSQYPQNLGYWESRESRDSQESQNHGFGSLGSPGVQESCTLPDVYSTKVNEQLTYVSKKQVSKISLSLLITKTTATLFLERYSR